jgi:hypothetical protein
VTLRIITPASGGKQLLVSWDGGGSTDTPMQVLYTAGQVLDVPPGGPLESAIGLGNLTALSGQALVNCQTASVHAATGNA